MLKICTVNKLVFINVKKWVSYRNIYDPFPTIQQLMPSNRELNECFAQPVCCCSTLYKQNIALIKMLIFQRSITIEFFRSSGSNGNSVTPISQCCTLTMDRKFRSAKVEWSHTTFHETLLTNSKGGDSGWTH